MLRVRAPLVAVFALTSLAALPARADGVPSAGQEAAKHAEPAPPAAPPPAPSFPVRSWELPPIDVPGEALPTLKEDERIGDYGQPRWTVRRRFPTTRMYVMPKGTVEFEWWMRYTAPFKDPGKGREVRTFWEFGFGLGHRFQADVYLVAQQEGTGAIQLKREQFEIRYALADWGKIWGNPTLYLEWQHRNDENDRLEGKILLGGAIAPRWHAGFNLVWERELGGKGENEYNLTGGLSYTALDGLVHVGAEAYAEVHDFGGGRWKFGNNEQLYAVGPSLMLSPIAPANIMIAPLFGAGRGDTGAAMEAKFRLWFIAGWTF
jgi:hypothetical protein